MASYAVAAAKQPVFHHHRIFPMMAVAMLMSGTVEEVAWVFANAQQIGLDLAALKVLARCVGVW